MPEGAGGQSHADRLQAGHELGADAGGLDRAPVPALVIDKQTLGHMGLNEGDKVQMTLHGQQLVITPVRPVIPEKDFQESLERVVERYGSLFRKLAD